MLETMDKLRTRLRAAVAAGFGGSNPRASRAAGLNQNVIDDILNNPKREPRISTLDALAGVLGWDLCDAVYWSLDRERPVAADYDPMQAMLAAWRQLGIPDPAQRALLTIIEPYIRAAASPNNAHSP